MRKLVIITIICGVSFVEPDGAMKIIAAEQMVGNPTEGLRLVRDTCADCHQVEPGQPPRSIPVEKSFSEIAADPKMTALSLKVFLRTPHIDMPDIKLTEEQTDDVIAYILSLK